MVTSHRCRRGDRIPHRAPADQPQRIPENYTAAPLSLSHHYQPVALVSDFSAVAYRTLYFILNFVYWLCTGISNFFTYTPSISKLLVHESWLGYFILLCMKRVPLPVVEPFDPSGCYFDWSVRGLT